MNDGKAIRPISKLFGKKYAAGDVIPAAVLAQMTPQVLRSLVDRGDVEVAGMAPAGGVGTGGIAHLTARIDRQADEIRKLQADNAAMRETLTLLEAKFTGEAPAPAPRKTRRAARAGGDKE